MNQIPLTQRTLTRANTLLTRRPTRLSYSTSTPPRPSPPPPQPPSKVLPTVLLVGGGGAAGLGAYYYNDPNAEIFKQARSALGLEPSTKQNAAAEKSQKKSASAAAAQQKAQASEVKKPQQVIRSNESKTASDQKVTVPQQKPTTPSVAVPPVPVPPLLAASAAAAATTVAASSSSQVNKASPPPAASIIQKLDDSSPPTGDAIPKHVLITALRAQQEALSESHDAKIKTIQDEYDRRLNNATQIIEAERVVDLRAKYEKASAALQAIEQGIEARTTQNTRAKRLRALWAQVNALHARVNHPEYHDSTTTSIDKPKLINAIEIPDQFVKQMVSSLPCQPVHSLESLKKRFYDDVEPLAKSVTLIKEGEQFSIWKYTLGKFFGSAIVRVNRGAGDEPPSSPPSSSPVQVTAHALDNARSALERSDLLTAAIAINQLKGLPRQVASDWLADARTLLETNQTLFVLMTYAASNNVF